MITVGLTGSIGMGKSTTAAMFRDAGAPVFDADATVHALYERGRPGAAAVARLFPECIVGGAVNRAKLRARVRADQAAFAALEAAIHPLVAKERRHFLRSAKRRGAPVVVLDVPLLFETGAHNQVDYLVVVSAPAAVQRARVLSRPGMTAATLDAILSRQTPDSLKRSRADVVIDTSLGLESARREVARILSRLRRREAAVRRTARLRRAAKEKSRARNRFRH